jgi:imidazolonepropionase-like amidohydrolase
MLADVSIFEGNPAEKISDVRKVLFVMKEGAVVRKN